MKDKEFAIIQQVIKNARKHKDQRVSIFIGAFGITVNVEPIKDETAKWIENENTYRNRYTCSACGSKHDYTTPYCPICGEKLQAPMRVESKED